MRVLWAKVEDLGHNFSMHFLDNMARLQMEVLRKGATLK